MDFTEKISINQDIPSNLKIYKTDTFEKIFIKPNSLILCDIDDTILRYEFKLDYFIEMARKDLLDTNDYIDEEDTRSLGLELFDEFRSLNKPFHTDSEGFKKLEKQIIDTGSTLIFVTARSCIYDEQTQKQLESIGIETKYPIHYTFEHKMSKADYIDKFIKTDSYSNIYFIDDFEPTVKLVKNKFPDANCIIFEYK